jgi:hypothetical protein
MREPEDSCSSVFCKLAWVMESWFWAARDGMLFRMLIAMK